jgi:precorrin-6B methylase 2
MPRENGDMWDIGCIAASVAFFIVAIAYIAGCDRLGTRESK